MSRFLLVFGLLAACDTATTPEKGCESCNAATEYCVRNASDVADVPDTYACKALPAACDNDIACDCLAESFDSGSGDAWCLENGGCEALVTGPLMVTCPGG